MLVNQGSVLFRGEGEADIPLREPAPWRREMKGSPRVRVGPSSPMWKEVQKNKNANNGLEERSS